MVDGGGFSPPYDFGLVNGLRADGVDVRLVLPAAVAREWNDPDAVPTSDKGLLRGIKRAGKVVSHAWRLASVRWEVARGRVALVHFQWLPLPAIDYILIRWLHGRVPMVFTMHNTSLFHGTSAGVQGWRLDRCFPLFDRIVVHGAYSRERALHTGVANERQLVTIPHGAFEHYAALASPEVPRPPGPVQLLFAGTVKPYKGLADLIEALAAVAASCPAGAWHLTIAGQPSYSMESLRARAEELGVAAHISWSLRAQSEREMAEHLQQCDVVVLPYREIDQSGVLLAAVGMRRAVVATAIGAFPEIVRDGENGLLVPPSDSLALGRAIARLINDSDLRVRCASGMAVLSQGELNWRRVAQLTRALYGSLLLTRDK
jgi:glycosyltransferase involved in cell wall biosynthesis